MKKNEFTHKKNAGETEPADIALQEISFEWLFKRYFDPLCRYAQSIVDDEEEAKDVVSHFFLKLLEEREKIFIHGKLSAYIYKCIKNACLDNRDKEEVRRQYSQKLTSEHGNEYLENLYDDNPLSSLITQEKQIAIEKAITTLPGQCRQVFELVWYERLKYHEIAYTLGITVGAVGKQLDRAKTKIRQSIEINEKRKK